MKQSDRNKPRQCPICGNIKIAEILYGMPGYTPELRKLLEDEEIVQDRFDSMLPTYKVMMTGFVIHPTVD